MSDLYDTEMFAKAEESLLGITAILTSDVREDAARAVLDAVAPLIAAKALRDAADKLAVADPSPKFAPGWMAAEMGLRARAATTEAGR